MERVNQLQKQYLRQDERIIATHDHEHCLILLREHRLLQPSINFICHKDGCVRKNTQMTEVSDKSRLDGVFMRCYGCSTKQSIRANSIFEGSKLPLITLYRCLFSCFLQNMSIIAAQEFCGMSESGVQRIFRFCKHQISNWLMRSWAEESLCRHRINFHHIPIVEVDETLITHLRDPLFRTRSESQCWVLGVIERSTGEFRCIAIGNDRTSQNISKFFCSIVHTSNPRTIVYTDGAAFYGFLNERGYERRIVNHSVGFGSGTETTNHIESLWSEIKRVGKFDSGWNFTTIEETQHALNEVCWRIQYKNTDLFSNLVNVIRTNYEEDNTEKLIKYV